MSEPDGRVYRPPDGDAPLDAIEQALVRMWIRLIVAKVRAHAATESDSETT